MGILPDSINDTIGNLVQYCFQTLQIAHRIAPAEKTL